MYLRWQYLGPSWTDPNPGRRRFVDKHPVTNECRYRLSVVKTMREPEHKTPHQQLIAYLGVVDEAQLNTSHYSARYCFAQRNLLMDKFKHSLDAARRKGLLTSPQYEQIRAAIHAAFPPIQPPPGGSFVVIPPKVKERAVKRAERDTRAMRDAWHRQLDDLRSHGTGDAHYDFMRSMMGSMLSEALDEHTREDRRSGQGNP
jgi:hypothetical protein